MPRASDSTRLSEHIQAAEAYALSSSARAYVARHELSPVARGVEQPQCSLHSHLPATSLFHLPNNTCPREQCAAIWLILLLCFDSYSLSVSHGKLLCLFSASVWRVKTNSCSSKPIRAHCGCVIQKLHKINVWAILCR